MLSTFTVMNANDSGAGSLRQAIVSSNDTPGTTNAIYFDIPGNGVQTIEPLSPLPALTQPVTIDATTQPGYDGQQTLIQIDGSLAGPGAVGLDVTSSASGSSFHGLSITDFSGGGMLVDAASNVAIVNDDIGLVQNSVGDFAHGNGVFGVEFEDGANNNGLGNDVISGQAGNGVVFAGSGTSNNSVVDSEIGTDPSGTTGVDSAGHSLANTWSGVAIADGASNNTVSDDVISNNSSFGVYISDTGTAGNVVEGSFIGTNNTGSAALPNYDGILIQNGATDNTIGALSVGAQSNVISGNTWDGVHIVDSGTTGNVVEGNYIGITPIIPSHGGHAAQLPAALGNGASGVAVFAGANNNTIGGTTAGAGNVISANKQNGVFLSDSGTTGNVVAGDFIGTDPNGWRALPNFEGVVIQNGATDNTIGGTTIGARDVISGNNWEGVHIVGSGTSGNVVAGNYIGVSTSGSALANAESGVGLYAGASGNVIGGSVSGSCDVISGNDSNGVYITDSGTSGNIVAGDDIGTDPTGAYRVPNWNGVVIQNGAADNTIGGTTAGDGDVISGNNWEGVHLSGSGTAGNVVAGDYIGLNAGGTTALPNSESGVGIYGGASDNTIGGTSSVSSGTNLGAADAISGNGSNGVYITDPGTNGNVVAGDYIGTNASGSAAVPNYGSGVVILNGAADNVIGGTSTALGDIISGNQVDGVDLGSGANFNTVESDSLGTSVSGRAIFHLPNKGSGVAIYEGASDNSVVDDSIAYNDYGLYLTSPDTAGNMVEGDSIWSNTVDGVCITNGASDTFITGSLISTNGNNGIEVDASSNDNTIESDTIECNQANGVAFAGGSSDNSVDDCTIIWNVSNGVEVDANSTYNTIVSDTLEGNGASGVYFAVGSSGNSVDYCTIEYNTWGIFDTGSHDSFNGNTVINNNTNWVVP